MNDHVFKEIAGELAFVGDFEKLYCEKGDPWDQSGAGGPMAEYYARSRRDLVDTMLRYCRPEGSGIEIGCGHGHVTAAIAAAGFDVTGVDVSPAAIERARSIHPRLRFIVGDVTEKEFVAPMRRDFVLLSQCLWYVLHAIDQTVENCLACLRPGGNFIISQAFLREQRYGRHISDGFWGASDLFRKYPMDI